MDKTRTKKGFFVFEPLTVIIFISAVLMAAFITLGDRTEHLNNPLGTHATNLVSSYLSAETDVFLPREMLGRYAVEDSVYKLAASAGTAQVIGGLCVGISDKPSTWAHIKTEIPEMYVLADNFEEKVRGALKERIKNIVAYDYVISVHEPLVVVGVPLRPDQIEIPLIKKLEGVPFEGGILSYYHPRLSFTAKYNYPLEDTYTKLKAGLDSFVECRAFQSGDAKTLCVNATIEKLNNDHVGVLQWSVTQDADKPDDYLIDIQHQYKMPMCQNFPLTKIRLHIPTTPTEPK